MKLLDILLEIANTPYHIYKVDVDLTSPKSNEVKYYFETDKKRKYYISFKSIWVGSNKIKEDDPNWKTSLTFNIDDSKDMNREINDEDFGKILATVITATESFIKDYKPEYITYQGLSAGKERSNTEYIDSTKRQRIYDNIAKRELKNVNSDYEFKDYGSHSDLIYKKDLPIPGSNKIFNYPEQPFVRQTNTSSSSRFKFNLSR